MLKRAMDVFYASVGTAVDFTKREDGGNAALTMATAAAASCFYSLTGASRKANEATSSSESARKLLQSAWGMVSLPAVKNLSLQASKLLKGAAVADRIDICGVSCFVLSSEPAPELAAAIKRYRRNHIRRRSLAALSTIDEQKELNAPSNFRVSSKPFARSCGRRYRLRDVIFHLTGGGFFAHIIASDLPYLLDWSASTGAVVICPEYCLLPEHAFPDALHQIEDVYRVLVSNEESASVLGFEVNRIVITGESAGGNLAAALCVKNCIDVEKVSSTGSAESSMDVPPSPETSYVEIDQGTSTSGVAKIQKGDKHPLSPQKQDSMSSLRMPDALMLSCPVLNLSLEMSHSRVVGTEDPVLPSGLVSAISNSYIPPSLGISKKDPLASPFYANDAVLARFPATLLFASSNDPLLDDSVVFNQRLRSCGVESDLFAAQNLPHAYLGLGTAGFPEALQVQNQCVEWLNFQFTRNHDVTE
jgi:acetyl esterase/lipase